MSQEKVERYKQEKAHRKENVESNVQQTVQVVRQ